MFLAYRIASPFLHLQLAQYQARLRRLTPGQWKIATADLQGSMFAKLDADMTVNIFDHVIVT